MSNRSGALTELKKSSITNGLIFTVPLKGILKKIPLKKLDGGHILMRFSILVPLIRSGHC